MLMAATTCAPSYSCTQGMSHLSYVATYISRSRYQLRWQADVTFLSASRQYVPVTTPSPAWKLMCALTCHNPGSAAMYTHSPQ